MDEPQIRYAHTCDGVNIAYFVMGSGPPVVVMDLPASNVLDDLRAPDTREIYERTARVATLVRYDHRGWGLSDKTGEPYTTEALVSDLEAVVDKLALERFFLVAARGASYPVALEYARRHPERLVRMALLLGGPPSDLVLSMLDAPGVDWDFFTETVTFKLTGWTDIEGRQFASRLRASIDRAGFRRFIDWFMSTEPTVDPSGVATPTLVVAMPAAGQDPVPAARDLASRMPDAAVHVAIGATQAERAAVFTAAISAFFMQAPAATMRPAVEPGMRGAAVILFIDIAGSTALTERLGDDAFRAASRALDDALRAAIRDAGGAPVEGKVMGDGVMATFASAHEAISAARRCNELSADSELRLHVGIHAGDVIREPGNVYGGAVNIAARICDASSPGEILVSDVVRGMARTSAGVTFEDRGEHEMKGVGEPVHVYVVRTAPS